MKKSITNCFRLTIAGFFLLLSIGLFGQNPEKRTTGKVTDASKVPIAGATVLEIGTMNGTVTDTEGRFELELTKSPAIIEIRILGFKTLELQAESSMEIELEEDLQLLEELVVIGYGSVKKEDLTGSVSAIKAEEINRGAVTSSHELLKGKVPGLLVLPDGKLRIRGTSSLNASNDPLIVIDGVPLSYNDLSSINPDDIKSFTVLKDASSAAIYGSRAAGGVIIVTTKIPEKNQKLKISYSGSIGISNYVGKTDVLSPDEFRNLVNEIYAESPSRLEQANELMGDANTDWIDLVTQTGITHTHNLAFSGTVAEGHLPYRLSLSYIDRQGTLKGDWRKTPNFSLNILPNFLDDHLTVNINARLNTNIYSPGRARYSRAAGFNPTLPVYFENEDGSIDYNTNMGYWIRGNGRGDELVPASNAETNPMQYSTTIWDKRDNLGYILNGSLNYKVHGFEDLSLKLNIGTDGTRFEDKNRLNPDYWGLINDGIAPGVGTYYMASGYKKNKMLESFASYSHDFNGHNINAMAGYSYEHFYYFDTNERHLNDNYDNDASNIHYVKDELYGTVYEHGEEHYLISFYTRLNYSFKSKYLLTVTLREDGSSRFSPEARWGLFPSTALAWNLKEENFLKNSNLFSQLKLRVGKGVTGQESGIANYSYIANYNLSSDIAHMYNMGSDSLSFSLTPDAYDPNIKWEETVTINAGLDFGIMGGRIRGSLDIYKRTTYDLLNTVTIPLGANFSNTLLTNIGNIENKGTEFTLDVYPIMNSNMSLQVGLTGTSEKTEFTKLTLGDEQANEDYYIPTESIGVGTGGFIQQQKVGYAPQIFYTYKQVYDADGDPIQNELVDSDGNEVIDDNDRYLTGKKPMPDFYGGLLVKFRYKNWDFGFNGHGSKGNWVFNNYARSHSTTANDNINYNRLRNFHRANLNTGWTETNTDPQNYSDHWLEDASFLKLDDINMGYSFENIFKKQGTSLRLAATVNNVLIITNYTGVDPEIGLSGIDGRSDPKIRTFTLRTMLNF